MNTRFLHPLPSLSSTLTRQDPASAATITKLAHHAHITQQRANKSRARYLCSLNMIYTHTRVVHAPSSMPSHTAYPFHVPIPSLRSPSSNQPSAQETPALTKNPGGTFTTAQDEGPTKENKTEESRRRQCLGFAAPSIKRRFAVLMPAFRPDTGHLDNPSRSLGLLHAANSEWSFAASRARERRHDVCMLAVLCGSRHMTPNSRRPGRDVF